MELSSLFDGFLIASGAVYCAAILWLVRGLYRPLAQRGLERPSLSIIVAARNEEQTLPGCLAALQEQVYQGEWEVIVVDDRLGVTVNDVIKSPSGRRQALTQGT